MALTPAERQRRYKAKLKQDTAKYEEYKRKKRENYHKKKRLVKDLTPKEKYYARIIWRLRKQNLRNNRKKLNALLHMTPPSSPSILVPNEALPVEEHGPPHSPQQYDNNSNISGITTPQSTSSKQSAGRKKVRRDRSKLYRENLRLKQENENLKKKYEKYKKRFQRNKKELKKEKRKSDEMSKYKKLSNAIKDKYQKLKKNKEKKILKSVFNNSKFSKEIIKDSLGLSGPIRHTVKIKTKSDLEKKIQTFFERLDVSRPTAGKKETVTRGGKKIQKRFLLDTMKNLHKVFKYENPETRCSYYYFTKKKPFYIVKPTVSGREMCLCKTHTNPAYKANALKNSGVIKTDNINDLITATVCDPEVKDCMYGTCDKCCEKKIQSEKQKNSDKIQWQEWGRVQEQYEKDEKTLKVFKNVKQIREGTCEELLKAFNEELKSLKKHVYNIKVQFRNFRQAIDDLKETEAVVVADFSENYNCKLHEEIQAHHFGGSRSQVSLHTVVVYLPSESAKKVESYCTVSANTNHQPAAIWAHLYPVLDDIRNKYPLISTIHFFTDGPFTQYRQKQNFYLASTIFFDHKFKAMTWSFFEAGHGKGPADGIGGFLKRKADDIVATGGDILSADIFYQKLKNVSKIKLELITSDDIEKISKQIPPNIQPLTGTKNVHQILSNARGELKYRDLSCFCSRGFCSCLSPKEYCPFPPMTVTRKPENSTAETDFNDHALELLAHTDEYSFDVNAVPSSTFVEDILNSNDDLQKFPLQEIDLLDLSKPRNKNLYNTIYRTPETSDDEQKPSTSKAISDDKENRKIKQGDFMLVNVHATKNKCFKYVCLVDDLHDDGEIRVTFLRSVKKKKNVFRLEKNDIADIDYTDVIELLVDPIIMRKRGVEYFVFDYDINILEK